MSKLLSLVRRAPKRTSAVLAMIAAVIIVPAALFAWGPDRPTYTQEHPADHVTFDSITNNPEVGDERNFVRIKEDGTSTYQTSTNLEPGKVYDVSVYYHNNAASNLGLVAHNTTLKMEIPGVVKAGVNAAFTGTISASNATPGSVWDEAYGKNATNGDVALRYVTGSATVVSNGAVNGAKLPDSLFTTGALLGYDSLNGDLPGCNQYAGFVNFKIRVDQPNFTVQKQVSVDGGKTWSQQATTQPGADVLYRIVYENTGTTQQDNVILRDMLPKDVSYVPGSSLIANSTTGGTYKSTIDGVTTTGINAGSYQPQGNVYYKFSAKMPSVDQLQCGVNTLTNTARATTSAGYKEDTATVTINKECQPPTPVYTCDALTASLVSGSTYKFDGKASASNGASIVSYAFDFGDGKTQTVTTSSTSASATHEYPTTGGTYTAKLNVTVSVNGTNKTVTSENCAVKVTIPTPETPVYTCDALTASLVSGSNYSFTGKASASNGASIVSYAFDFGDGNKQTVTTSDTSASATHEYAQTGATYTATLNVTFKVGDSTKTVTGEKCSVLITVGQTPECKPGIPMGDTRCNETPTTPPVLPQTGAGDNIAAVVGLGSLIAAISYYVASRRGLLGA